MQIGAVMDEVAAALATIPTLKGRTFAYLPETAHPPAALVDFPGVEHDVTFGRGADRLTLPVTLLVARVDSRSARDRLLALQGQVKAAIEDRDPVAYHSARVTGAEFNHSYPLGGVEHMAVAFTVDIIGSGS